MDQIAAFGLVSSYYEDQKICLIIGLGSSVLAC